MPLVGACAGISPLKVILAISCNVSACSTHKAATLSTGASSSRAAEADVSLTSTAAVPASPSPIDSYPARRVACMVGNMFDYAVLWQAGFRHVTCSLGTHLNADQFRQLCDRPRTVYLTFDVDGSGQQASQQLAHRLRPQGIVTRRVLLPEGHDPNSFFVQGGDARQFHSLLEAAQP